MNITATPNNHIVAVYATHDQAEAAVKALNSSGYDMRNLSVVGQNYATDEQPVGFVNTGDRMVSWGKIGAFWGSLWGLLFGSAMLVVPGVGSFIFAGWLIAMLEGAVLGGGLAALGGALSGLGIPKDSVIRYETALKAGQFLVLAHGSEADVNEAKKCLGDTGAAQIDAYTSKQLIGAGSAS
jgi:hypothetical protein